MRDACQMQYVGQESEARANSEHKPVPTVSAVLPDGRLVEMLYRHEGGSTALAIWDGDQVGITHELALASGERLVPYRGDNPLLTNRVVLFPSEPVDPGASLVAEIAAYIHRYVDLSLQFERLAVEYVLFTWVYDCFQELPYLRLHGEYGSGKTRFLQVVGSICRTPIFAGGASTVSPLFHLLDRFAGTLLLDEADFRFSDERAQLVKILNNGNVQGFPVLRSESTNGREYRPVAFQVFGPKIVAMRGEFDDRALESRFISERSDGRTLRTDIPLNLPKVQAEEAQALRNKLLMYRFHRFAEAGSWIEPVDRALEPRVNQVFSPLLANIEDRAARDLLRAYARGKSGQLADERSISVEAELLAVLRHLNGETGVLAVSDIADLYSRAVLAHGPPVSARHVGGLLRKRLGLRPQKSNGVYIIGPLERGKLSYLFDRYRITEDDAARVAAFDTARALELTFEPIAPPAVDVRDIGDVRAP